MTELQQHALALAYAMLETEFSHVLILVRDKQVNGGLIQPDADASWAGGLDGAESLARLAIKRLDYSRVGRRPPTVSKKVMDEVMAHPPTSGRAARK